MAGTGRCAGAGGRLWRGVDLAVLLLLNAVAVTVLALAWSAVRDKAALADQTTNVAVAIGGLVVGAVGNAWFLLAGKGAVAGRAAVLLRPGGVQAGDAAPVAIVVPLPGAVAHRSASAPAPAKSRSGGLCPPETPPLPPSSLASSPASGRRGWCRLYWDRLFAMATGLAGAVALLVGWLGLSGVLIDHRQVPWVLGGSFLGLWLLGVAGTAWLAAVLRDQWSALARIAGRLAELGVPSVAEIPAPALPSRDPGNGRIELRGADGIPSLL